MQIDHLCIFYMMMKLNLYYLWVNTQENNAYKILNKSLSLLTKENYNDNEMAISHAIISPSTVKNREREEMGAIVSEYQSFWNGHTDEMRRVDWQNDHVVGEDIDVSGYFILVIGKYNTSGNQGEMGQAYHDWATIPAVEQGVAGVGYNR